MNCIAKNKCPDSQKLRDETTRDAELRASTRVKSNDMYIFAFFLFDSFYVMQEKIQKILLSFWNKVLFCWMFVLLLERDRSVIRLDKAQ